MCLWRASRDLLIAVSLAETGEPILVGHPPQLFSLYKYVAALRACRRLQTPATTPWTCALRILWLQGTHLWPCITEIRGQFLWLSKWKRLLRRYRSFFFCHISTALVGLSFLMRFFDHTQIHHTQWVSSGWVIGPSQRPVSDKTPQCQETDNQFPQRDLKPQSREASGRSAQPPGSA
jgi:hypothetical protein